MSTRFSAALRQAGEDDVAAVRTAVDRHAEGFTTEDGTVRIPARTWVAWRPPGPISTLPHPMFYDDDADLTLLDGKTVAIIGYGSQGHAHALNLKDSGVDVVVGLRPDSSSVAGAGEAGLEVAEIPEAASRGDLVMVLLPDERHGEVYREQIADGVAPGNMLLFGHGFRSTTARSSRPPASTSRSWRPRGPGTWSGASTWRARACPG